MEGETEGERRGRKMEIRRIKKKWGKRMNEKKVLQEKRERKLF